MTLLRVVQFFKNIDSSEKVYSSETSIGTLILPLYSEGRLYYLEDEVLKASLGLGLVSHRQTSVDKLLTLIGSRAVSPLSVA